MRSKTILIVIIILLVLCIGLSIYIAMPRAPQKTANIMSEGVVIKTVNLSQNAEFNIQTATGGYNRIVVKDGKIAVTEASCPDHVCISFGWCDSGMPIVCLPNEMIIDFPADEIMDSVSG